MFDRRTFYGETTMQILIDQEKALHQYDIRHSEIDIQGLLHPTFLEVGRSGETYNFDSIVELMLAEELSDFEIHSQDYECIDLEAKVKLLLYKSAHINSDGSINSYTKRSSIWVLVQDKWQMKYHQGTPCQAFGLNP